MALLKGIKSGQEQKKITAAKVDKDRNPGQETGHRKDYKDPTIKGILSSVSWLPPHKTALYAVYTILASVAIAALLYLYQSAVNLLVGML
mgnify:FL=1